MESVPDMPVTAVHATPESVSLLKRNLTPPPHPKGGIPKLKGKEAVESRVDSDDKVNLSYS